VVASRRRSHQAETEEDTVSKRARKKRDRKKNAASHGKRPNS
jgi:hypothetical protein